MLINSIEAINMLINSKEGINGGNICIHILNHHIHLKYLTILLPTKS